MTDAIKALHDYLSKSPSVVYPQDVLEYLPAIEADNAKLRKLVGELMPTARIAAQHGINVGKLADQERRARDLGVEVDE